MDTRELRQRIAELSPEKRALLEQRLLKAGAPGPASGKGLAIPRRDGQEPCPLSFAQQRLWFLQQLEPDSSAYNTAKALRMTGALDVAALGKTLDAIVERHEALRTNFVVRDGTPLQVVAEARPVALPVTDLSTLPEGEREAEVQRRIEVESRRVFDLARDLMLRAALLRLGATEHVLLLTLHHVASDGWSIRVLVREMAAFYEAFAAGGAPSLPPLPIQYADYSVWQREWLQGPVLESQLAYWRHRLDGAPSLLDLPTDRPRPAFQTFSGAHQATFLPAALAERVMALSRAEGVTPFMTLLAAFQTLLSRYTGQDDIVVGSPIAGRTRVETEGLIGFFVNTLVLRTDLSGDPTFLDVLRRTRDVALGAYAHQDVPFEKLVEELHPERDPSRSPIFQVMFAFQNMPPSTFTLPGLSVASLELETGTAKFDLTLYVDGGADGLRTTLEYNSDRFDAGTITRMLGHLRTLVDGIVADPGQRLSALPLLTDGERHQLLVAWNDTSAEYPRDACIHELFEAQAGRTPHAGALISRDGEITYGELNRRANQLAHYLRTLGVGPGAVVGICMPRSIDMVTALLGILKAGGAYLPLDSNYPRDRLAFMLEDARPPVVVTQEAMRARLPRDAAPLVCLDTEREAIAGMSDANPAAGTTAESVAYVIYTSGSTGTPKGVLGLHRGAVNRFAWMWAAYPFARDEVCCQKTSLNFVDSVWELFGPLLQGIRTVIVPDEVLLEPGALVDVLATNHVSRIVLVPSLLRVLLDAYPDLDRRLPHLAQWICSGEMLSRELRDRFVGRLPHRTLLNLYGSSEVSADSTAYEATRTLSLSRVPIGRPIANTRIYLLDRHGQPVPVGVPGELHVGGDGLARGYLGRPELTAEKFVPDPFAAEPDARMYRTGDVARYLPDGALDYLGRLDDQVKVRGFRVELGEIEMVLARHPGVKESAVVVRDDTSGEQRLVAYVVAASEHGPPGAEVRQFLREKLPDYMVPTHFVGLDRLPLSPNGKIDRRSLPVPGPVCQDRAESAAPRDSIERELVRIWEEVLGVQGIGVRNTFFDLGGHSLLGVRLFAQIEKALGRRLPLATLFTAPTIAELAMCLREKDGDGLWSPAVAIQSRGARLPLFCAHPVGSNVLVYRDLARGLGGEQPVYGLQPLGLDGGAPHTRIEDMAAYYIEAMRTVQPEGPYRVAGTSFGGVVAFEIAQQLHAKGQTVGLLALFDTRRPGWDRYPPATPAWRRRLYRSMDRLARHALNFRASAGRDKPSYLWDAARSALHRAGRRAGFRVARVPRATIADIIVVNGTLRGLEDSEQMRILVRLFRTNRQAYRAYVPRVYPGRITLFRARRQGFGRLSDPTLGWGPLAGGGIDIREVPGEHGTCCREPHVERLAEQLRECLDQAHAEIGPFVGPGAGDPRRVAVLS